MRRINAKAKALDAVPTGGYVEVLRDVGSSKESKPQYLPLNVIANAPADTGDGISDGVGAVLHSWVENLGTHKKTTIFVDITGVEATTDLGDILGTVNATKIIDSDMTIASDWYEGAGWEIGSGVATCDGSQTTDTELIELGYHLEPNATYEITFDFTRSAGILNVIVARNEGTDDFTTNGTKTIVRTAAQGNTIAFKGDASFAGTIDNVVVKQTRNAYLTGFTDDVNGAIYRGIVTCLVAPVSGELDIDFYVADENTGTYGEAIADLTETALYASAGDWAADINLKINLTALPSDGEYLYLVTGDLGSPGKYTAGQFLFEFWGD